MMHVALRFSRRQGINALHHLQHVQRGDTQNLGFATFKQCRPVRAWNQLNFHFQITDIRGTAAIHTVTVTQNLFANDFFLQCIVGSPDFDQSIIIVDVVLILDIVGKILIPLGDIIIDGFLTGVFLAD